MAANKLEFYPDLIKVNKSGAPRPPFEMEMIKKSILGIGLRMDKSFNEVDLFNMHQRRAYQIAEDNNIEYTAEAKKLLLALKACAQVLFFAMAGFDLDETTIWSRYSMQIEFLVRKLMKMRWVFNRKAAEDCLNQRRFIIKSYDSDNSFKKPVQFFVSASKYRGKFLTEDPFIKTGGYSMNIQNPLMAIGTYYAGKMSVKAVESAERMETEVNAGKVLTHLEGVVPTISVNPSQDDFTRGEVMKNPIFYYVISDDGDEIEVDYFECDPNKDKRRSNNNLIHFIRNQKNRAQYQLQVKHKETLAIQDIKRFIAHRLLLIETKHRAVAEAEVRKHANVDVSTQLTQDQWWDVESKIEGLRLKWLKTKSCLFTADDVGHLLNNFVCAAVLKANPDNSQSECVQLIPYSQYKEKYDRFVEERKERNKLSHDGDQTEKPKKPYHYQCFMQSCDMKFRDMKDLHPHLQKQSTVCFVCSLCDCDSPKSQFKTTDHYGNHFTMCHLRDKDQWYGEIMERIKEFKKPEFEPLVGHVTEVNLTDERFSEAVGQKYAESKTTIEAVLSSDDGTATSSNTTVDESIRRSSRIRKTKVDELFEGPRKKQKSNVSPPKVLGSATRSSPRKSPKAVKSPNKLSKVVKSPKKSLETSAPSVMRTRGQKASLAARSNITYQFPSSFMDMTTEEESDDLISGPLAVRRERFSVPIAI